MIAFAAGAPPRPGRAVAGIEIDIVAGYGVDADAVPEPLKQAIRQLAADWYENRGTTEAGGGAARISSGVAALIAPYRVLSL